MSAIAGLVLREARPQAEVAALLERMLDAMPYRGPDGHGAWASSRAALGHLHLINTPQSRHETLPLRRNSHVLACDMRLDGHADLVKVLASAEQGSQDLPDSELLYRAYERWGEKCSQQLLGEWAFAVWDEAHERLFLSRDPFGMRSLYVYQGPQGFAFATELKALLALPFVPRRLNEERLADHLTLTFADQTSTFYRDIERLPPAHTLVLSGVHVSTHRYYELDAQREFGSPPASDYARGLYDVFEAAVHDRMRVASRDGHLAVGALLSGGLDSSSVAGVAQQNIQLAEIRGAQRESSIPVVSAIFPQVPACDERPYIDAVLKRGGFAPHWVHGDEAGPLTDIENKLHHLGEPVFAPGFFLTWELLRAAQDAGLRVLLDGHGGDEVISLGDGYLTELARAGQWRELWEQCVNIGRVYGDDVRAAWWSYYRTFGLVPVAQRSRLARVALRGGDRLMRGQMRHAAQQAGDEASKGVLLAPAFAQRNGWEERQNALNAQRVPGSYGRDQTARATHFAALTDPLQVYGLEVLSHAAGAYGIEITMPFWDRRVVEYCLALPGREKSSRSGTRAILRSAMSGALPEEVRERTTKNDFTPNFVRGLREFERDRLHELLTRGLDETSEWINGERVRQAWKVLENAPDALVPTLTQEAALLWQATQTALWLRTSGLEK